MKKIQISAKNVQKAIEQGLVELGVKQEDVDIKILDQGGLFRKAKVEIIYDDGVEEILEDKKEQEKEQEKEIKKQNKEILKSEKKQLKEEKKQLKKEEKIDSHYDEEQNIEKVATEFLTLLCQKMGVDAQITCSQNEFGLCFNAHGDKINYLIGKRGETLNAIQELLSTVVKNVGFKNQKVFFDVENYKNRRELTLINLANRVANKVKKINKPVKLERMSAYERKIIHTALQDVEGVTTKSEGEEPNRHLVVIPKK